jgi:peroxiredoxin
LRSFQQRLSEFDARGVRVVAISNDSVDVNKDHRQKQGFTFPLLSDEKVEVARRYDLLHAGGGSGGGDIARPAEFLIDSTGTVRWVNLTGSVTVRARPDQVLAALDAAGIR